MLPSCVAIVEVVAGSVDGVVADVVVAGAVVVVTGCVVVVVAWWRAVVAASAAPATVVTLKSARSELAAAMNARQGWDGFSTPDREDRTTMHASAGPLARRHSRRKRLAG